ncbi:MAG TPA: nitrite reductase, partial [Nitrososphaeraceae archaeon]
NPDLVLTNGMSHKYVPAVGEVNKLELNKDAEIFKVKPGELTRWYIVNAGPNDGVSFHFISGMITVRDGTNQANNDYGTQDINDETWWITPASGSVIESTFPDPGVYVGVDHAMKDVVKGGAFAVLAMENSTATDHPQGTCVAAAGEGVVCAPAAEAEGEQTAAAEGEQTAAAEGEQTAATEDEQSAAAEGADNQTETQGGDGGNNDDNANDENGN